MAQPIFSFGNFSFPMKPPEFTFQKKEEQGEVKSTEQKEEKEKKEEKAKGDEEEGEEDEEDGEDQEESKAKDNGVGQKSGLGLLLQVTHHPPYPHIHPDSSTRSPPQKSLRI